MQKMGSMQKMASNYQKGYQAEELATRYMINLGYSIVARRWKKRGGEIDLIVCKNKELVMVEIKTRKRESEAIMALSRGQRKRITELTKIFLAQFNEFANHFIRFDLILVNNKQSAITHHIENAWEEET